MSTTDILYLVLLLICILLSAFSAGAETAFMSLQKVKLQHMLETRVKRARRVARLLEHPERFLVTVRAGANFADTAATVMGTALAISLLGQKRGLVVATFVLTALTLIFSDITPKALAVRHNERMALALARPIEIISWLLSPFVAILSVIVSFLVRVSGGTTTPRITTAAEIKSLIRIGHREGAVAEEEAEMLQKVFEFGDRPVREIMVPRPDVVGIEKGSKVADYLALYAKTPFSRMPVYKDSLDNIFGIISDKDVLVGLANGTIKPDSIIDELIRPVHFSPENKPVSKLFKEIRDNNYRMAVVVDEYGGTAGIVTLSRMTGEVMGEFGSEIGTPEKEFEVVDEHTFQIDGSMRIEDINEEMGLVLPKGDYETIAGFILSILGHIPRQGEQLRYKNLKITVSRMTGVKIEEVLITREDHAAVTH